MTTELICPNCGASASLPLEMTCRDHRPVLVEIPNYDHEAIPQTGSNMCVCGAPIRDHQ